MSDDYHVVAARLEAAQMEQQAAYEYRERERFRNRPSIALGVSVARDGNQWCALYGTNIQEGVCGFGDSPDLACADFDREWIAKIGGAK